MFGQKTKTRRGPAGAILALAPVVVMPAHLSSTPTETGWAPFPGAQHPSQQIGAFAGQLLNQFPAILPGVQLHSGREWGATGWYYPSLTALPNGSVTQTTVPNNISGGQRYGSAYQGGNGPTVQGQYMGNVISAQVRQSGLRNAPWAQGLFN